MSRSPGACAYAKALTSGITDEMTRQGMTTDDASAGTGYPMRVVRHLLDPETTRPEWNLERFLAFVHFLDPHDHLNLVERLMDAGEEARSAVEAMEAAAA